MGQMRPGSSPSRSGVRTGRGRPAGSSSAGSDDFPDQGWTQRLHELFGVNLGRQHEASQKCITVLSRVVETKSRDQLLGAGGRRLHAPVVSTPEPGKAELAQTEQQIQPEQTLLVGGKSQHEYRQFLQPHSAGQVSPVTVLEGFLETPFRLI